MKSRPAVGLFLVASFALYGCDTGDTGQAEVQPADAPSAAQPGAPDAPPGTATVNGEMTVELMDREGRQVGTARLSEDGEGVRIAIQASGLPPGPKGFHFHQVGQCEPPAFQSAGGHFDPTDQQHGLDNPQGPHAGDMENLEVGTDGTVNTEIVNPRVTLRQGQPNSLLDQDGTALVIHAERDDQRTDPTGESGDRIACGVISADGARGTL